MKALQNTYTYIELGDEENLTPTKGIFKTNSSKMAMKVGTDSHNTLNPEKTWNFLIKEHHYNRRHTRGFALLARPWE